MDIDDSFFSNIESGKIDTRSMAENLEVWEKSLKGWTINEQLSIRNHICEGRNGLTGLQANQEEVND